MLRSNGDVVLDASRQNGNASTFAFEELMRHHWLVLQRAADSHLAARGESVPVLVVECRGALDLEVVLHIRRCRLKIVLVHDTSCFPHAELAEITPQSRLLSQPLMSNPCGRASSSFLFEG